MTNMDYTRSLIDNRRTSFSELPTTELLIFSKYSIHTKCRFCHSEIMTSLKYQPGKFSWLLATLFCFSGFCLGCCIIPCCVDGFKDVIHVCPECNNVIGRYRKL